MSTEFPPVIIDSSTDFEAHMFSASASGAVAATDDGPGALTIRGADFSSVDKSGRLRIEPSEVSLYLIRNNSLVHKGTYRAEALQLIDGAGNAMAVGGSPFTLHQNDCDENGVIRHASKRVRAIRVPGEEKELEYGVDFMNFILIVQRKR